MKTVINIRWIVSIIIFLFLIAFGVYTYNEEGLISVFLIIIGALLIGGYAVLIPLAASFSHEGITVKYCFCKIFSKWEELKHIEEGISKNEIFPWLKEYRIGYFKSKNPLLHEASIPKNKRTTEQIEMYYTPRIEKI